MLLGRIRRFEERPRVGLSFAPLPDRRASECLRVFPGGLKVPDRDAGSILPDGQENMVIAAWLLNLAFCGCRKA